MIKDFLIFIQENEFPKGDKHHDFFHENIGIIVVNSKNH
jgi:hypothetical protein